MEWLPGRCIRRRGAGRGGSGQLLQLRLQSTAVWWTRRRPAVLCLHGTLLSSSSHWKGWLGWPGCVRGGTAAHADLLVGNWSWLPAPVAAGSRQGVSLHGLLHCLCHAWVAHQQRSSVAVAVAAAGSWQGAAVPQCSRCLARVRDGPSADPIRVADPGSGSGYQCVAQAGASNWCQHALKHLGTPDIAAAALALLPAHWHSSSSRTSSAASSLAAAMLPPHWPLTTLAP
ncbi:hypothetical protein V8C86DRAFT_2721824 [Haematococcus lacustris]